MDEIEDQEIVYRLSKNTPLFLDIKDWIVKLTLG